MPQTFNTCRMDAIAQPDAARCMVISSKLSAIVFSGSQPASP
jgi:hypothetical protein